MVWHDIVLGMEDMGRRKFLKFLGGAAAMTVAGVESAQAQRKSSREQGKSEEILPEHLAVVRKFADSFLAMFGKFDKKATGEEIMETSARAIDLYLRSFAIARGTQASPPMNAIAIELAFREVSMRPKADIRAIGILQSFWDEARLQAADDANRPMASEIEKPQQNI